jgi:hypothetical protein
MRAHPLRCARIAARTPTVEREKRPSLFKAHFTIHAE